MTQRSSKELDAIDARLRILIPELPPKASPTRNPEHAKIVILHIIKTKTISHAAEHPLEVSELAIKILDLPEIIG